MAEFCLECWNKLNKTKHSRWRYILSLRKDFCEECSLHKNVIIKERIRSRTQRMLQEAIIHSKVLRGK